MSTASNFIKRGHNDRSIGFRRDYIRWWFEEAGRQGVAVDCVGVPNFVSGSSLNQAPAKRQKALLFHVFYLLFDQTVLSKGYSNCRGAVRLVADLGMALLTSI